MASFPVQVLLGLYLGLLTGVIPAVIAWALGFVFKYVTGVTIPGLGVVVLGVAIAGVQGGLMALNDPTIRGAPNSVTLTVALIVVLMLTLYAHNRGDRMGAELPRRITLRGLRRRTLSSDVVELVGGRGQVRVSVLGEVEDLEGYPPVAEELRREIAAKEWTFPADLPLSELETRLRDRLRSEFDVAEVTVHIDQKGRASIAAAPPAIGLSKRVPAGKRAASIDAVVPTGLARHDEVRVHLPDGGTVSGTVVSARSGGGRGQGAARPAPDEGSDESAPAPDGGDAAATTEPPTLAGGTTAGGEGRVTLAIDRVDATALLRAERGRVVVRARGTRREFELLSLLRRAGQRFRKLSVGEGSELAGRTLGGASVRDTYGVAILAVRGERRWVLAPRGETLLRPGADLFAVGTRDALDGFAGVLA